MSIVCASSCGLLWQDAGSVKKKTQKFSHYYTAILCFIKKSSECHTEVFPLGCMKVLHRLERSVQQYIKVNYFFQRKWLAQFQLTKTKDRWVCWRWVSKKKCPPLLVFQNGATYASDIQVFFLFFFYFGTLNKLLVAELSKFTSTHKCCYVCLKVRSAI